ncbi:MAG: DEAD/DEAH box helicase, partial [bacterium]
MSKLKRTLSRLTLPQANALIGTHNADLIRKGGEIHIDIDEHVTLTSDRLSVDTGDFSVDITLHAENSKALSISSSTGRVDCPEVGAVLALILEEKMALGLSKPPPERVPVESLSPAALRKEALRERTERAAEEPFDIRSADPKTPWTDYAVTNHASGKSYKVALRGLESGENFCSCPDFKVNRLGTCKHIIRVTEHVKKHFTIPELAQKFVRERSCITVDYKGDTPQVRLLPGSTLSEAAKAQLEPFFHREIQSTEFPELLEAVQAAVEFGDTVHIFPDAEEHINAELFKLRLRTLTNEIRRDPEHHPLRYNLLKTELRPYQVDGIAFAVSRGRAILADDMGLGKTLQGIGVAELLAREARISKVLIICPASLKSQWRQEIRDFSDRDGQLVLGSAKERAEQYDNDCMFTICNYEQILRDIKAIEEVNWDLIILDEAQRIKNWETKTSKTIKELDSRYALVLTGTPLENRLEELYNIVSFVDNQHIGPAYEFLNRHRIVDEKGKVLGYKNLEELRRVLSSLLLRRTRAEVLSELPPRQTEVIKIPPTEEQLNIDTSQRKIIGEILGKKYVTEMDLLRLQKALLLARMAADGTYLIDKQTPHYSSKLDSLRELVHDLLEEERKIIVFSEWTTMLDLIEQEVLPEGAGYVRLDGSVPQKKRASLVREFSEDANCRLILMTNAGATGLNLQAADTVLNIDLPWNPALLEQRIGRAHRMGQTRPVQVYMLVTADTIEDKMLITLGAKKELFQETLEAGAEEDSVALTSGIDELKKRLEVLLGTPDDAPIDVSRKAKVEA